MSILKISDQKKVKEKEKKQWKKPKQKFGSEPKLQTYLQILSREINSSESSWSYLLQGGRPSRCVL